MPEQFTPSLKHLTEAGYGIPKEAQLPALQELTRPHIDSFNYVLQEGLRCAIQHMKPCQFALPNGQRITISIVDATIGMPKVSSLNCLAKTLKVYPAECRERGATYRAPLQARISCVVDNIPQGDIDRILGEVPIMVKSKACNLSRLSPAELVRHGEEEEEMGGYFVINGIERIVRILIMPRRQQPICLIRPSWKTRGKLYTEYGVSIRCVRDDQFGVTNVLHYLSNGTVTASFSYNKEQFFVPVILLMKALVDVTDHFIYQELTRGRETDSFYKGCIASMLRQVQDGGLLKHSAILKYMGERFRVRLTGMPTWFTDVEAGVLLLRECICIHLSNNMDKFRLLVSMTRKLFSFVKGQCCAESADNPANQELLLGGHLYLIVLAEKMEGWLNSIRTWVERKAKQQPDLTFTFATLHEACKSGQLHEVTRPMEYLMATGNLISRTGLGLMQATGLTVVADKLNFLRYMSHFRCVHRGAFFTEMRTTAVRRLLPEAWGFLCPVHTPDGAPCGLLNHMSAWCEPVNTVGSTVTLPKLLCSLGMTSCNAPLPPLPSSGDAAPSDRWYEVMLDGRVLGWLPDDRAPIVANTLRLMKVKGLERVPPLLEIVLVPKSGVASQYPGLYLFTSLARMMRPVKNLQTNSVEYIGTFEQVYLNVCVSQDEAHPGITTHEEIYPFAMLSEVANQVPFSDFNQSPRNMYQCQMGKQTMGTPCHAIVHRSDNKLYRLQTPQSPLVRPYMHDHYGVDNYPLGTNAVVAVISYTGYDMEDAMIINKASYDRGFCHGSIYKSEFIDLRELTKDRNAKSVSLIFGCKPNDQAVQDGKLSLDGLPNVGSYLEQGDPYYSYINVQTGEARVEKYKHQEPGYVDHIKILGSETGSEELQKICIMIRIQRNPIIGDKFASRHGQKGICSQKWPVENMPFTESGLTPDIIFNPHGFPSRMTIGMMIEFMAGKSAACHGLVHDATPFQFSEDDSGADFFGRMLTAAGFNYHCTERMYSGVTGREIEADIFVGVVYYQRLRHMVSDKFQVRTTGPIDNLTHQPVKGRKKAGGIRFGEMERDALIAHGSSFLLHDRLFLCSDKSYTYVCTKCGSILSPTLEKPSDEAAAVSYERKRKWICSTCQTSKFCEEICMPYVFRYLAAELAAVNIKVRLELS